MQLPSENDLNKHLKSTHHWCCNRQQYDTVFNIFLSVIYIYQFSQSQRTAEFEQDLWRSSSLQCSEQGHWSRFLQDHVQFGFEYLQGQRFHNLPRQPVPMFYHPQSKKMVLVFKWNLSYVIVHPFPLVLSLDTTEKSQVLSSLLIYRISYTVSIHLTET